MLSFFFFFSFCSHSNIRSVYMKPHFPYNLRLPLTLWSAGELADGFTNQSSRSPLPGDATAAAAVGASPVRMPHSNFTPPCRLVRRLLGPVLIEFACPPLSLSRLHCARALRLVCACFVLLARARVHSPAAFSRRVRVKGARWPRAR